MYFNAAMLREKCKSSLGHNLRDKGIDFKEVSEGKYPTQEGCFEILSPDLIMSLCVWSEGQVEICLHPSGEEETRVINLEYVSLEQAVQAVQSQLERCV